MIQKEFPFFEVKKEIAPPVAGLFYFKGFKGSRDKKATMKTRLDWVQEIVNKWDRTRLLDNYGLFKKHQLAIILENQREWNEQATDQDPQWKRISIPLCRRIFDGMMMKDLICLQAMPVANSCFYLKNLEGEIVEHEWSAGTRRLKTSWGFEAQQDGHYPTSGLDYEAELTAILSSEIAGELDKEIADDLGNNVIEAPIFPASNLAHALDWTSNAMQPALGHRTNWIVVGEKDLQSVVNMPGFVPEDPNPFTSSYVNRKKGRLNNRWDVYYCRGVEDPLIGYKGDELESGYAFGPFIALTPTPVVLDRETFCPRKGILMRYAKKVVDPRYYGKIILTDREVRNSVIINGVIHQVGEEVTYEQVMTLAGQPTRITVYDENNARVADLPPGDRIAVTNNMRFHLYFNGTENV